MNIKKLVIFGGILLDVIGIAVFLPALPGLKTYYAVNDFNITLGLTIYSLFSFIAAPIVGQLSDRYGRKISLIWCVLGTAISYLILLIQPSYLLFILSRIINGITGGNISILQATLSDISQSKEEKTANFSLMGALFGLGFIIGPVIGSGLLHFGGVHGIFWGGGIFSIIELLLLTFAFSNTNKIDKEKYISFNSIGVITKYFHKAKMKPYLISLGLLGIGAFMINGTQSLYMNNTFATSGEQYGYYLAGLGILSAINMAYMIPKFWTKNYTNKQLLLLSHLALIIGYAIVGFISQERLFLGIFFVTSFLGNIYNPIYTIEIMSQSHPDDAGEISGMLGGIQSLFMFIGPLLGGIFLEQQYNTFAIASICCIISLITLYSSSILGSKKNTN